MGNFSKNAHICKTFIKIIIEGRLLSIINYYTPYSRKHWWELNLTVEPKITTAIILADLHVNLAVQGLPYASRKFWQL